MESTAQHAGHINAFLQQEVEHARDAGAPPRDKRVAHLARIVTPPCASHPPHSLCYPHQLFRPVLGLAGAKDRHTP
eukprot:9480292-Pyramimonas_sp.AAC.1